MRTYALALMAIVAGCGDDTTTVTPSSTPPAGAPDAGATPTLPPPTTTAPADLAAGGGGVDGGAQDGGLSDGGVRCDTVALATAGTMASAIAVDDSGVYFTTDGGLWRAPLDGGVPVALGARGGGDIALGADAVFTAPGAILRWPKSGGEPITLDPGSAFLPAIQLEDAFGYLYWRSSDAGFVRITRVPDDGSGAKMLITAHGGGGPMAFDSTYLWESTTHGIFASAPDGSGPILTITSPSRETLGALAVDDTHVFVGTHGGRLWSAEKRNGATLAAIATTLEIPLVLLADGSHLYALASEDQGTHAQITRYAPDGSGATVLADRVGSIGGMALHGGFLYYTLRNDSTVYRVCK